jgi:hypothetical protein
MAAAKKAGLMGRLPPEKVTESALAAAGQGDLPKPVRRATSLAAHFAFGTAAGAAFAIAHRRLRPPSSPIATGVLFGGLVWLVSYAGWIPALGIMPPPGRDRPGRPTSMLLAHGVFGAVLGALVEGSGRRALRRLERRFLR